MIATPPPGIAIVEMSKPTVSFPSIAALSALLRSLPARDEAARYGPSLFPPGPERALAAAFITGDWTTANQWLKATPTERSRMSSLLRAVEGYRAPEGNEDWCVALVRNQAALAAAPLAAAQLRWAADRLDAGAPLSLVKRAVLEALDLVERQGVRP
jgi:hypothetical protein